MKKIILIVFLIIALVAGWSIFKYYRSFHVITFTLGSDVSNAAIYASGTDSSAPQKIKDINGTTRIKLQNGGYFVRPSGDKIDTTNISFTVQDRESTIDIDPAYSDSYLQAILKGEQSSLNSIIRSAYPNLINNYTFSSGQLYVRGDWYAATLLENPDVVSDVSDTYRTILHKENGQWVIVVKPQLVISGVEYPQIPHIVISKANQLPLTS